MHEAFKRLLALQRASSADTRPAPTITQQRGRDMQPSFLRIFASASIIAAAVSIFSPSSKAAPIPLLPDATYYNAVTLTLPNSDTQEDGGYTPHEAQLVGYIPAYPTSWNFLTSNDYRAPRVGAYGQAGQGVKGAAGSFLTYYIAFEGAAGNVPVKVLAAGGADAAGENDGYGHNQASAFLSIRSYDNGVTGP